MDAIECIVGYLNLVICDGTISSTKVIIVNSVDTVRYPHAWLHLLAKCLASGTYNDRVNELAITKYKPTTNITNTLAMVFH